VLLPGFDAGAALTAASSIVERISTLDFAEMGQVTVSAGIALAPQHARKRDELLRLVDSALYRAKEEGKNRADVYRPDVIELAELDLAAPEDELQAVAV
jgi:diguanylate cyclase (GGDEF)-like protein